MSKEHTPNYNGPIQGVTLLQPQQCKTCIYRDRTTIVLDGVTHEVGWDKDTCGAYVHPEWKPNQIMRNTAECPYYESDE